MKKFIPSFVILAIGICIAIAVKANKPAFVTCCTDTSAVCKVIGNVTLYGPLRPGFECP
jgi:hypothetical protein